MRRITTKKRGIMGKITTRPVNISNPTPQIPQFNPTPVHYTPPFQGNVNNNPRFPTFPKPQGQNRNQFVGNKPPNLNRYHPNRPYNRVKNKNIRSRGGNIRGGIRMQPVQHENFSNPNTNNSQFVQKKIFPPKRNFVNQKNSQKGKFLKGYIPGKYRKTESPMLMKTNPMGVNNFNRAGSRQGMGYQNFSLSQQQNVNKFKKNMNFRPNQGVQGVRTSQSSFQHSQKFQNYNNNNRNQVKRGNVNRIRNLPPPGRNFSSQNRTGVKDQPRSSTRLEKRIKHNFPFLRNLSQTGSGSGSSNTPTTPITQISKVLFTPKQRTRVPSGRQNFVLKGVINIPPRQQPPKRQPNRNFNPNFVNNYQVNKPNNQMNQPNNQMNKPIIKKNVNKPFVNKPGPKYFNQFNGNQGKNRIFEMENQIKSQKSTINQIRGDFRRKSVDYNQLLQRFNEKEKVIEKLKTKRDSYVEESLDGLDLGKVFEDEDEEMMDKNENEENDDVLMKEKEDKKEEMQKKVEIVDLEDKFESITPETPSFPFYERKKLTIKSRKDSGIINLLHYERKEEMKLLSRSSNEFYDVVCNIMNDQEKIIALAPILFRILKDSIKNNKGDKVKCVLGVISLILQESDSFLKCLRNAIRNFGNSESNDVDMDAEKKSEQIEHINSRRLTKNILVDEKEKVSTSDFLKEEDIKMLRQTDTTIIDDPENYDFVFEQEMRDLVDGKDYVSNLNIDIVRVFFHCLDYGCDAYTQTSESMIQYDIKKSDAYQILLYSIDIICDLTWGCEERDLYNWKILFENQIFDEKLTKIDDRVLQESLILLLSFFKSKKILKIIHNNNKRKYDLVGRLCQLLHTQFNDHFEKNQMFLIRKLILRMLFFISRCDLDFLLKANKYSDKAEVIIPRIILSINFCIKELEKDEDEKIRKDMTEILGMFICLLYMFGNIGKIPNNIKSIYFDYVSAYSDLKRIKNGDSSNLKFEFNKDIISVTSLFKNRRNIQ